MARRVPKRLSMCHSKWKSAKTVRWKTVLVWTTVKSCYFFICSIRKGQQQQWGIGGNRNMILLVTLQCSISDSPKTLTRPSMPLRAEDTFLATWVSLQMQELLTSLQTLLSFAQKRKRKDPMFSRRDTETWSISGVRQTGRTPTTFLLEQVMLFLTRCIPSLFPQDLHNFSCVSRGHSLCRALGPVRG